MEQRLDAIDRVFAGLSVLCAQQPKTQGARVCAGLVYRRRLVAIGYNTDRSDPWQQRFGTTPLNIYLHAETMALKRGLALIGESGITNASLFVCRLRQMITPPEDPKVFEWGLSKPCHGCQRAIETYNVRKVYYTISPNIYATWVRHTSTTKHRALNRRDANILGISHLPSY